MKFKVNLKELREKKWVIKNHLAKKLDKFPQSINNLETQNSGSIEKLKDVCLALGYTHNETAEIILKELDLDVDLRCV